MVFLEANPVVYLIAEHAILGFEGVSSTLDLPGHWLSPDALLKDCVENLHDFGGYKLSGNETGQSMIVCLFHEPRGQVVSSVLWKDDIEKLIACLHGRPPRVVRVTQHCWWHVVLDGCFHNILSFERLLMRKQRTWGPDLFLRLSERQQGLRLASNNSEYRARFQEYSRMSAMNWSPFSIRSQRVKPIRSRFASCSP